MPKTTNIAEHFRPSDDSPCEHIQRHTRYCWNYELEIMPAGVQDGTTVDIHCGKCDITVTMDMTKSGLDKVNG